MLKEEESNFIGQGAYGCVYKQNLTCANDKNANKKQNKIKEKSRSSPKHPPFFHSRPEEKLMPFSYTV